MDDHRDIRFKYQEAAGLRFRAVDHKIIETDPVCNPAQGVAMARAEGVIGTAASFVRHIGKLMDAEHRPVRQASVAA